MSSRDFVLVGSAAPVLGLVLVVSVLVNVGERQELADVRPVISPDQVYNPVTAGEPIPAGFRQLLARDQIAPIYNPDFTTPNEID